MSEIIEHFPRQVWAYADWRIVEPNKGCLVLERQVGLDAMNHPIWEGALLKSPDINALVKAFVDSLRIDLRESKTEEKKADIEALPRQIEYRKTHPLCPVCGEDFNMYGGCKCNGYTYAGNAPAPIQQERRKWKCVLPLDRFKVGESYEETEGLIHSGDGMAVNPKVYHLYFVLVPPETKPEIIEFEGKRFRKTGSWAVPKKGQWYLYGDLAQIPQPATQDHSANSCVHEILELLPDEPKLPKGDDECLDDEIKRLNAEIENRKVAQIDSMAEKDRLRAEISRLRKCVEEDREFIAGCDCYVRRQRTNSLARIDSILSKQSN